VLFNSFPFLFVFLPVSLLLHWLVDRFAASLRLPFLLVVSIAFYGYWDFRFVPLLLLSIAVNWTTAVVFQKMRVPSLIAAAICANLGVLAFFKYSAFIGSIIGTSLSDRASVDLLPLGISFFTFHHIMYLADLRAGKAPWIDLTRYGLYISFFPQVLSGPLVRWSEIIHQFDARPYARPDASLRFAQGITLVIMGLGKNVLLGDPLGKIAEPAFLVTSRGVQLGPLDAWQGVLAFTFQIYFDFSGYTDMAIGIALMFGILLPQNFDAPYRATSIQDFWRRWHMTLSRFLRDYLYIPLGGNRRGLLIQVGALLTTMTLGGLWHGAGWTFVLWGVMHGVALSIALLWQRFMPKLAVGVTWLATFAFVTLAWVPFRADSIETTVRLWQAMFGYFYGSTFTISNYAQWPVIAVAAAIAIVGPTTWDVALVRPLVISTSVTAGVLLTVSIIRLANSNVQQFIYFQF
jgi:alginate O-acetyltransferase complex protein AlgI